MSCSKVIQGHHQCDVSCTRIEKGSSIEEVTSEAVCVSVAGRDSI